LQKKIIEQERKAREYLKERGIDFEDQVYRDYGILTNAKKISSDECSRLISIAKLGVDM